MKMKMTNALCVFFANILSPPVLPLLQTRLCAAV